MKVAPRIDVLKQIIRLKLDRVAARVALNHQATFSYDSKLVDAVFARCIEVDGGARHVDPTFTGTLLPEIAEQVLQHMVSGRAIERIELSAARNGAFLYIVQ